MVPVVTIPPGRSAARHWAVGVVMDRLFSEWALETGTSSDWLIGVRDPHGELRPGTVCMPDVFFRGTESNWLAAESLPKLPLPVFEPSALGIRPKVTSDQVPVLFGQPTLGGVGTGRVDLGIDVFGSAFFMLSRYEEAVVSTRDRFNRFPASTSVAHKGGFLGRPLVDEYLEILWEVMRLVWPDLVRKPTQFRVLPSHDVDEPSRDAFRGVRAVAKESVGDLLKRRHIRRAIEGPWHWLHGQVALHMQDPFNTFDRLMDLSEQSGTESTFFFKAGCTNPEFDCDYRLGHRAIRRLLRRIHNRGHLIGLHPSFETYLRPDLITQEADRLRDTCRQLGIVQDRWGARMHYLRWRLPETWRALQSAGLSFDATLGYADVAGFRCGTCHEYRAFDVLADRELDLIVQPLVAMDVTVMNAEYMGLGTSEGAHQAVRELRRCCEVVGGQFSLLWHNNQFQSDHEWSLYKCALQGRSS